MTLRHACHSSAEFSLAGSPPASPVIRWSRVSSTMRPAALNRRSMVSSGKHRRSRVQRLSSAMICADRPSCPSQGPRGRRSGWASAQRRKSRSRCRTVRPCGKPQLEVGLGHLGQGHVSVLRSQVRKSAAATLSRSCAYLRTLLVTGPWRSAGDPARRNSAAASRGLRIYVEFGISRLMPTTGLCRPWRGAHPFGLPAARARLCRAVGATGTSRRPADSSPTPRTGFDLPQREGAGRWGLTR